MTVLRERDAEIVRRMVVDGESCRRVGRAFGVSNSTAVRVAQRFRREMAVFVGPLEKFPPDALRGMIVVVLSRAAAVRAARERGRGRRPRGGKV